MKHRAVSMEENSHTRTLTFTDFRSKSQEKGFNIFPGYVGSIRSGFDFLQCLTVFFVHAIKMVAQNDTTSTVFNGVSRLSSIKPYSTFTNDRNYPDDPLEVLLRSMPSESARP